MKRINCERCASFVGTTYGSILVVAGHELFQLALNPALGFVCLAMRAVAVPAGMRDDGLLAAV